MQRGTLALHATPSDVLWVRIFCDGSSSHLNRSSRSHRWRAFQRVLPCPLAVRPAPRDLGQLAIAGRAGLRSRKPGLLTDNIDPKPRWLAYYPSLVSHPCLTRPHKSAEWIVTWRRSFDTDTWSTRGAHLTTLTRWKLACALFAGIAGFATVSAHKGGGSNTPARRRVTPRVAPCLRSFADPCGSAPRRLACRSPSWSSGCWQPGAVRDIQLLTDKLGAVGDDDTIDALAPLLHDARRGVPEAILAVYGQIGTEHAVKSWSSTPRRPPGRPQRGDHRARRDAERAGREAAARARAEDGDPGQGAAIARSGSWAPTRPSRC